MQIEAVSRLTQATTFGFQLPQEYGYVLIVACLFAVTVIAMGYIYPQGVRK